MASVPTWLPDTLRIRLAMYRTSFALGSDVSAFTGPGGNDLRAQLTNFTWTTNKELRVNFATQNALGTYTMTVGPGILSVAGHALDQDKDLVIGESIED